MGKESEGLKKWRKEQPRGAIMKPETFSRIEQQAEDKGLPPAAAKKVAGRAYWDTAEAKYDKAKRKK